MSQACVQAAGTAVCLAQTAVYQCGTAGRALVLYGEEGRRYITGSMPAGIQVNYLTKLVQR